MVSLSSIYVLNPEVVVEGFSERALALHCTSLRLVELNATARDLLARLDGQASLARIATAMAHDYQQPEATLQEDLCDIIAAMAELNVVVLAG